MTRAASPFLAAAFALLASTVGAETLVASHTIRSKTVLAEEDLAVIAESVAGALTHPAEAVGMEARVVLYAGRPIRPDDIGPPALIDRNQTVTLVYNQSGLSITTEGRALGRAALGESVRAMNLSSRTTVTGVVDPSGQVIVKTRVTHP